MYALNLVCKSNIALLPSKIAHSHTNFSKYLFDRRRAIFVQVYKFTISCDNLHKTFGSYNISAH